MSTHVPKVSIGLPLYNAERFLEPALDSILAQTFTDFELIVSDNASTDETEAICRAYMARDPRIRYVRNERNVGAQRNHNRVFHLSRGQYFKWAGYDDKHAPDFLRRTVEILDTDPSIVLCFSRLMVIDEEGRVRDREQAQMDFRGRTPHERLRRFFQCTYTHKTIYGLIRRETLARTALHGDWYGSDRALLMELSLYGSFHILQDDLFYHREHRARSAYVKDKVTWFTPQNSGRFVPGFWRRFFSGYRMLRASSMSPSERTLCLAEFVRKAGRSYHYWVPRLTIELAAVVKQQVCSRGRD